MDVLKAKEMAEGYLKQYGLNNWQFKFDRSKRRFGLCSYTNKTISLSMPLTALNSEDEVKDTILHELAHALVGSGHGHNHKWKVMAAKIGARPQRCYSANSVSTPEKPYVRFCPRCKRVFRYYHRQSKKMISCVRCTVLIKNHRKFDMDFLTKIVPVQEYEKVRHKVLVVDDRPW